MKPLFGLFFVTGLLLTAGCAPGVVSTANPVDAVTTPVAQLTEASTVAPSSEPGNEAGGPKPDKTATPDPNVQKLILLAVEDLSKELQTGTVGIQVSSIQAVDWPDPSLGCPKLGIMYAQVVTPGYIIVLELNGKDYPFHTDGSSTVVYCQDGGLPDFQVTPGEIQDGKPWMPVP
jgi:hypothetical protein